MSIAVSAVIHPCVYLRMALACFALLCMLFAVLQASGYGGPYRLAPAGVGATAAVGAWLALFLRRKRNRQRIDISGVGQIRLTVYQGVMVAQTGVVTLLPGSTLWPYCMVLRLGDISSGDTNAGHTQGRISVLHIWPGNVGAGGFRALALACRLIAARSTETV